MVGERATSFSSLRSLKVFDDLKPDLFEIAVQVFYDLAGTLVFPRSNELARPASDP